MAWDLIFWLYAFASVIGLIALTAYQLISLSDLEYDYINPYDSSSRINAVIIPEFAVQGALCTLTILTWHWFPFLLMAPVTYYHIRLFMKRQHHIDVTEIFRVLNGEKMYRMIKLALYFSIFIVVTYSGSIHKAIPAVRGDMWVCYSIHEWSWCSMCEAINGAIPDQARGICCCIAIG